MSKIVWFILTAFLIVSCSGNSDEEKYLLVYNPEYTAEVSQLMKAAQAQEKEIDTSSNLQLLEEESFQQYRTVILAGVPGDSLNIRHQTDLERHVQAGGGLLIVGTELKPRHQWPWYNDLMASVSQSGELTPFQKTFDGGRVSYLTSVDNLAQEDLQKEMAYAMGSNSLSYDKARSPRVPEENRFTRIVLDNDLNEPMELDILPDGSVVYIERRGAVKLYNAKTRTTKNMGKFEVCTEGNYEDGLLGVALDPQYSQNQYAYFYYSAVCSDSVQRLSRFRLTKDSLVMNSEKMILEVPVQRETCCHSGGSIQFGPDGLLYLSTGDNTSSKESDGYTPIDERPGRAPYDAQKSSGNTMDLRGKILRIKLNQDGSYTIPEGNLFADNPIEGLPEIYVMGARNPFRISIDHKTGWLYWGDVGPDAGVSSPQGPESFDEWNQARSAGNYGWPYFEANNIAYPDYDFTTLTPGEPFDPENPVNDSPNNTGSLKLPPARGAMIWYPYGESEIWPNLGTGSRSAMAGPIYYSDLYQDSNAKFPSYYDGKLFIYEWARSWIKVISFDKEGKPARIEPFLPEIPISKPIDMEFGPDGALYYLEYGANYFAKNDEARLIRIEYAEDNRIPIAQATADKVAGAAPLTVQFSAKESFDYDTEDQLTYHWEFQKGQGTTEGIEVSHTFTETGTYNPKLIVRDKEGQEATSTVRIQVGNAPPKVEVEMEGNSSFYFDKKLPYKIVVTDPEDGSTENGGIPAEQVFINYEYLPQGQDLANLGEDAIISPHYQGRNLMESSDCMSCHATEKASIGPTYLAIAERYAKQQEAVNFLTEKISAGGSGNWGHSMMPAHPQHSAEEIVKMVEYILSLKDEPSGSGAKLSLTGTLPLDQHIGQGEEGTYFFTAQYTDKGANGLPALSDREMIRLRHPRLQAEEYTTARAAGRVRPQGGNFAFVGSIGHNSELGYKDIDLTAIEALSFRVENLAAGTIEVHLNSPDGPLIAEAVIPHSDGESSYKTIKTEIRPTTGRSDLYLVFKNSDGQGQGRQFLELDWIYFHSKK
ncbi:PQQ-dependent sugar dehydrogenase [Salegentibacter sp. F188]|uniref:PQQ-dependent sugar dehydrogenase n=1 Tax=Autumnicola patrickiae TaxID=3075591 RepID=A0ABU3DZA4_9FLAO|nr:PQQ-dependent sugar dehydrogenase [Salegentibacter sp. F188]MDT0689075.1 PQQ-dependent sugar dehydrogenase [Salegentibacter sp. F188]